MASVATAKVVHFWWIADTPDPSKPWSRAMCDREQESRFPSQSSGWMAPNWERVTCPECLSAR